MKTFEISYKNYKEMTSNRWMGIMKEKSSRGGDTRTEGEKTQTKASLSPSVLGIPSEIALEVITNITAHSVHSL